MQSVDKFCIVEVLVALLEETRNESQTPKIFCGEVPGVQRGRTMLLGCWVDDASRPFTPDKKVTHTGSEFVQRKEENMKWLGKLLHTYTCWTLQHTEMFLCHV